MSTFYIMNVEGTPTARASWNCEGMDPQDPRDLVKGDCVQLTSQRWCVHDVVLTSAESDEPGSRNNAILLVPESK